MPKRFLNLLYVFFVLSLFIFSGCEGVEKPDNTLKTDFTAYFDASYRGCNYSGRISANRQGVLSIDITSPPTIDGLSVKYYSGEMHISRDTLDASADEAYLPNNSFPSVIKSVLDGINSGKATVVSLNGNECERTMQVPSGNAIINSRDNIITQIKIKQIDFCIAFSNIKLIE